MFKIRKNDTVVCSSGRDKGKKGRVLSVFPKQKRAVVEGINFIKKHLRKTRQEQTGGIIQREAPIHISNLMLFCSKCNKAARVSFTMQKDGSKAKICKRCGEVIT